MLQCRRARRPEITKFKFLVLQQDVLNFDITMGDRRLLVVHMQNATAHIFQYMDNLLLSEAFPTKLNK